MTKISEPNKVYKSPPESLADEWPLEPEPIIPGHQHQDEFPIECLPEIIRECVVETCSYTQVPIAFASSTALGVAGASVQHLAQVARDDQTVGPISLYILNILRSGERKSTIHKLFQKGFRDRQDELIKNFKDNITFTANPVFLDIAGVKVLCYHGKSLDDLVSLRDLSYDIQWR